MNGEYLSVYDLRDIDKIRELSEGGLDILKYLQDDLAKIDIEKLRSERWKQKQG
jgi:hypothetical protein